MHLEATGRGCSEAPVAASVPAAQWVLCPGGSSCPPSPQPRDHQAGMSPKGFVHLSCCHKGNQTP